MAPLNVLVSNDLDGTDHFEAKVGSHGKTYDLTFVDVMNLIRARCGHEQKRLEFKK